MPNYNQMNKILEENGTCEAARKEEESYADHEADVWITEIENLDMEGEIK